MAGLLRELLKTVRNYFLRPGYREYLRVKKACRIIPPGTTAEIEIAGFTVRTNDAPSLLHLYEEIFVRQAFGAEFSKKDPLIWCCGANIGLEIFYFKKQYPECRIVAFEADPAIANVLQENVQHNQLKNVAVHHAAVAVSNGTISFRADGALGGKTGEGTVAVSSIRLAEWLAEEQEIDLLLIDIEGAENEVLPDCAQQLHRVKRLVVEWHGKENAPQELPAFLQLISAAGFRYRLNNKLPDSPFTNRIIENGFDAMVEIFAERS
jgi:FkbM family methyltransferase